MRRSLANRWVVLLTSLWLGFARSALALPALRVEKSRTAVEFLAESTASAVKIRGTLREGTFCSGALVQLGNQLTGSVQIPLGSLDTGIALRTRHMKEKYLETEKWPLAELSLGSLTVGDAAGDFRKEGVPFQGTLKLHGVEKPVVGIASVWKEKGNLGLIVELGLSLKEFGIGIPSFLGVELKDTVAVKASVIGPLEEIIL
jgi:polyisoprenoid-binding protein YceI